MQQKRYSSDLTPQQWQTICPLLAGPHRSKWPLPAIVNAVLYVRQTGCGWRQIPAGLPPWPTVYYYYTKWVADGRWDRISRELQPPQAAPPAAPQTEWRVVGLDNELIGIITIEEGPTLVGRWRTHCTPDVIMIAMLVGLEVLQQYPCKAFLNDASAATGDWHDLMPWLQYDLLPRVLELGLRSIATVNSMALADRLSHHHFMQYAGQYLHIQTFDEEAAARRWLRERLKAGSASQSVKPPTYVHSKEEQGPEDENQVATADDAIPVIPAAPAAQGR